MQKDTIIYIGAPDITTRSRAHAGSGIRTALGALVIASVLVSGIAQALNVSPISSYRSSGLPHISAERYGTAPRMSRRFPPETAP